MAVGAPDVALSDFLLKPLKGHWLPHHGADVARLDATHMVELQDHRIPLTAIRAWMLKQVRPDEQQEFSPQLTFPRLDQRPDFGVSCLVVGSGAYPAVRLKAILRSDEPVEVAEWLFLAALAAPFHLTILAS